MASAESPANVDVWVSYSPAPRQVDSVALTLPLGSCVADALRASGLLARHGLALDDSISVGVWTKLRPLDAVLRASDRIEIYRGLRVDPKEARRQRYRKQPAKAK
jgi:uncharacterized protein